MSEALMNGYPRAPTIRNHSTVELDWMVEMRAGPLDRRHQLDCTCCDEIHDIGVVVKYNMPGINIDCAFHGAGSKEGK